MARADFQRTLEICRRLRSELEDFARAGERLRDVETRLPAAGTEREHLQLDLELARKAARSALEQEAALRAEETTENTKLAALMAIRPSWFGRLLRTTAWQAHEAGIRQQIAQLDEYGWVSKQRRPMSSLLCRRKNARPQPTLRPIAI